MYLSTKRGLVPLFKGPDDPLLIEAIAVFDGDLSCCGAEHPDKGACDRELLMSPMLGLFYEIYRDRDGASRDAWAVVACVEIKILRRVRPESPRRPPRHRRDTCSMAWRCRFLTARRSQHGHIIAEKHWLISTQASTCRTAALFKPWRFG